jgi:hypothetical protein
MLLGTKQAGTGLHLAGVGLMSAEAAGELGRQNFNGLLLFHGHDVPLTLHSDN